MGGSRVPPPAPAQAAGPCLRSCRRCHGPREEDHGPDQEDAAGEGPAGADAERADAVVLPQHQHARLPAHRGVPGPPAQVHLDPADPQRRRADPLAVRRAPHELLQRLGLRHRPVPEAALPRRHHLQHQPLQVRHRRALAGRRGWSPAAGVSWRIRRPLTSPAPNPFPGLSRSTAVPLVGSLSQPRVFPLRHFE